MDIDQLLDLPRPVRDYSAEMDALIERWKCNELSDREYVDAIGGLGDDAFEDDAWLTRQAFAEALAQTNMNTRRMIACHTLISDQGIYTNGSEVENQDR